jgi:hypothetical protein
VNIEVILLGLTTIVRPTSTTAVVAILAGPNARRLLTHFVLAGLVFSVAIGTLVVTALEGLATVTSSRTAHPFIDAALGAGALCYAGAIWIGWLPRHSDDEPPERRSWLRTRLTNLTPLEAAVAGVLTHLPGLVYLAALNAIVAGGRGPASELLQVLVYNLMWFSLAITALVISVRRPDTASELLERLAAWARQHQRTVKTCFFGVLGGYLLLVGIQGLLEHRT